MYRLLSLELSYFNKCQALSRKIQRVNSDLKVKLNQSNFNNEFNSNESIRQQSTQPNLNLVEKKRKRRKKNNTKYYDLLVVTNDSTKQTSTSIQKLSSNDLKLLATTNLNLSELYKLKDLTKRNKFAEEHTYNNLTIIDDLPVLEKVDLFEEVGGQKTIICDIPLTSGKIDEIEAPPPQEPESDLLDSLPPIDSFQPGIVEEVETAVEEAEPIFDLANAKHHDQNARNEIAYKTLSSYLEVCSNIKAPHKGLAALNFHNIRADHYNDKNFVRIKNIDMYNALLKGFAAKGDDQKLEDVLTIVRKSNVKMNLQTFIAIFECYGRTNNPNSNNKIRLYVREALASGFTFDRILNEGTFLYDSQNVVLKTMRKVDTKYTPNYNKPNLFYNNHLVDHLNHTQQLNEPQLNPTGKDGLYTAKQLNDAVSKQIELEKRGYITIKSVEQMDKVTDEVLKYRETLCEHFENWQEAALAAFNRDLVTLSAQRSPLNYEPYMRCIPTKDFVQIIVDEAKKLSEGSETYSPTVNQLYRDLGHKVYVRYKVLLKQKSGVLDKVVKIHGKYCGMYASNHGQLDVLPDKESLLNPRQMWQWYEYGLKGDGATLTMDHKEWNPTVLQTIGKFLYHIVMHDLKVDANAMRTNSKHKNMVPAFYTLFRNQARIVKEEVKPHPILSRLYRASMPETLNFSSCDIPMLCPPVPWTSIHNGGYLVSPCDLVRLPSQATSQKRRMMKTDPVQLYPALDSLNQLASVPWRVNTEILDVILHVFRNGGSSKLDVPEPPSALPSPNVPTNNMDKTVKFKLFKQQLQYRRKKAEMYSLWCDCLYRLSLANHFRNKTFWLPHNMDFRGRVYPIPPHLNHLGSDLARSMLVFDEGRPLGDKGLDLLKLHLINLTGLKKRNALDERVNYANEMIDQILDSADDPLNGQQWWVDSDEPWQTLSCCMEIAKAIRSGNPAQYRSHFPVHQDGSCNGLQHYAALGRDSAGAFSVNLCPSDVPQDVYSAVVGLVEEQRQVDATNGIEIAKLLDGYVNRKVIKQTIMTTVYGVTRFGARLQIARQLKDIDSFPKDSVWAASSYLTGRTFDSLRTMFTSTREIQDWFTDCARLISAVSGQHVEWVTPMGLPIVQPYVRYKSLGTSFVYKPFHMDHYEKPNVTKQKNAFPPNFIHSLDSSHMMLTSLHCERARITFVSVHDCYWTHPSTVHIMNQICREQFVALHSEPILENLSMFLSRKYSYENTQISNDGSAADITKRKLNRVLRQLPKTGDYDIKQVLRSIYFFS